MNIIKSMTASLVFFGALTALLPVRGEEAKNEDSKTYPLTTCVVSGEKLGEMGKPYVHKYEGREVQFCCKNCLKDFNKDPKKYLKKLDDAGKSAKK